MLNEPRTYRQSPFQLGLVILVFGVIGFGLLTTMDRTDYVFLVLLAGFFGIIFLTALYSMTKKTILSDDEISTQTILGAKSLRWSEINRVSGRGYEIKLHNFDGDVTVAPSPQLPGYEEVVDWIGIKRPDLFNPLEYGEMKRSWLVLTPLILVVAMFIAILVGIGVFFIQASESSTVLIVPLFFMLIPIAVFSGIIFSSPQSIIIDGKSLLVNFIFVKKTISADQINLIELSYQQSRNGRSYFVVIRLIENKKIKISLSLNPSLPIVYLVLKNWHKKNIAGENSTGRF